MTRAVKPAWLFSLMVCCVIVSGPAPEAGQIVDQEEMSTPDSTSVRFPGGRVSADPYAMISEHTLFTYLDFLTTIRPYAGWRNSASAGESEAIDYVVGELEQMSNLVVWGLETRRHHFHTYSGTDFRETRVSLTIGGLEVEVPAFGISGHRDNLSRAMAFDSDGEVNDSEPDPVVVTGAPHVLGWDDDVFVLPSLAGRVVLVDYALLDRAVLGWDVAWTHANEILNRNPAAIVPITSFSNVNGVSHGSFAGDLPVWIAFDGRLPPILHLRLEDLDMAGISSWSDLGAVDAVRVTWDMDVFSPADSEYLVARVPGRDSSKAVILGAHIDSPNNPGGIDDGSGSVTILQVAQAIDAARKQPPVDLYIAWFGSHERGIYGSANFVADYQELLDRTLAMLQVDCLSVPVDGVDPYLTLETWSYGRFGDGRLTWPDYLDGLAADHGVYTRPLDYYGLVSDNTNFAAWNVPNLNMIVMDPDDPTEVHYAGHMHDPYDTADFVRREASTLADMAHVALAAALETGRDDPELRVTPDADGRVLFVASHTEAIHMTPTSFIDLGMALAWSGFDVDMVPFGQPVTAADLSDTDMVVVLPVHDYPSADGDVDLYDEAFTVDEVDDLEAYARGGGLLVITNSANRLKYLNYPYETNEDWPDMNLLANRFGVDFVSGVMAGDRAAVTVTHPLVEGVATLVMATDNGVSFTAEGGQVLARAAGLPALHRRYHGRGEVVVLADVGILGDNTHSAANLGFWNNLAEYARSR